jgi:hypothetical protein
MDLPADGSTRIAGPHAPPVGREAARSRRRRPSGEPPPLPHHLQTSGVRWLVAQGLGKVRECRVHELVMPRRASGRVASRALWRSAAAMLV